MKIISERLHDRFYSGPRYDGTLLFYDWVREHASAETRLLNMGAGPPTRNPTRIFKGTVAEVVGADVDKCVFGNDELDRAVLIQNGRLPLSDETFDLALSDYVLEHVENPAQFLAEVYRVLKPGGHFFFRTPNIYHYVALVSAATPHWFHGLVANRARANELGSQEPWPTCYKLNSRRAITAAARTAGFRVIELRLVEMEPSYLRFHALAFFAGVCYERIVNSHKIFAGLRANYFGCLTK